MKEKLNPEIRAILKELPIDVLSSLGSIFSDDKTRESVRKLLDYLVSVEERKILKSSGAAKSMDQLIEENSAHSFFRGRISANIIIKSVLENASFFAEEKNG